MISTSKLKMIQKMKNLRRRSPAFRKGQRTNEQLRMKQSLHRVGKKKDDYGDEWEEDWGDEHHEGSDWEEEHPSWTEEEPTHEYYEEEDHVEPHLDDEVPESNEHWNHDGDRFHDMVSVHHVEDDGHHEGERHRLGECIETIDMFHYEQMLNDLDHVLEENEHNSGEFISVDHELMISVYNGMLDFFNCVHHTEGAEQGDAEEEYYWDEDHDEENHDDWYHEEGDHDDWYHEESEEHEDHPEEDVEVSSWEEAEHDIDHHEEHEEHDENDEHDEHEDEWGSDWDDAEWDDEDWDDSEFLEDPWHSDHEDDHDLWGDEDHHEEEWDTEHEEEHEDDHHEEEHGVDHHEHEDHDEASIEEHMHDIHNKVEEKADKFIEEAMHDADLNDIQAKYENIPHYRDVIYALEYRIFDLLENFPYEREEAEIDPIEDIDSALHHFQSLDELSTNLIVENRDLYKEISFLEKITEGMEGHRQEMLSFYDLEAVFEETEAMIPLEDQECEEVKQVLDIEAEDYFSNASKANEASGHLKNTLDHLNSDLEALRQKMAQRDEMSNSEKAAYVVTLLPKMVDIQHEFETYSNSVDLNLEKIKHRKDRVKEVIIQLKMCAEHNYHHETRI